VSLFWLVSGKTLGGTRLYPPGNRLDREQALRLWTEANTWFSTEQGKKGRIAVGQLADLAVLSDDFLTVSEDCIPHISSVLTLLGGRVVHGAGDYAGLAPPLPPAAPDWSPVRRFGGYQDRAQPRAPQLSASCSCAQSCGVHGHDHATAWAGIVPAGDRRGFWGVLGCSCWMV
jgi:hypothetical protein